MAQRCGPDDPWPPHPEPWWRSALAKARSAGWSLEVFDGHSWGRVKCPSEDRNDRHATLISSTGRGAENVAKDLEKHVRQCIHGKTPAEDPLSVGEQHADVAEHLLGAAKKLWATEQRLQRALELLDLAADTADEADAALDRAADADDAARAATAEVVRGLRDAGLTLSGSPTPGNLVSGSDVSVREGQAVLRGVRGAAARALRTRLTTLRAEVATLRIELDNFR